MSKRALEKVAAGFSALVLVAAIAFWIMQIGDVLEFLRLANG